LLYLVVSKFTYQSSLVVSYIYINQAFMGSSDASRASVVWA